MYCSKAPHRIAPSLSHINFAVRLHHHCVKGLLHCKQVDQSTGSFGGVAMQVVISAAGSPKTQST